MYLIVLSSLNSQFHLQNPYPYSSLSVFLTLSFSSRPLLEFATRLIFDRGLSWAKYQSARQTICIRSSVEIVTIMEVKFSYSSITLVLAFWEGSHISPPQINFLPFWPCTKFHIPLRHGHLWKKTFVDFLRKIYEWKMKNPWKGCHFVPILLSS